MKIKIKTGNRKLDKRFKELNKTQKAKIVASITRGAKPTTIAKKINAFAATNKAQIRREFLKTRTAAATVASQINRLVAKKDKSYRDFQKLNRLYRDYYKAKENRAKTYREKQEWRRKGQERYAKIKQISTWKQKGPVSARKGWSETFKEVNRVVWKKKPFDTWIYSETYYSDEYKAALASGATVEQAQKQVLILAISNGDLSELPNGAIGYKDANDYVIVMSPN